MGMNQDTEGSPRLGHPAKQGVETPPQNWGSASHPEMGKGFIGPHLWQQEKNQKPLAPAHPSGASIGKFHIVLTTTQECLRAQPMAAEQARRAGFGARAVGGRLAHSAEPSEP